MTTYTVSAWNEYSIKPEFARLVSRQNIEAENVTQALNIAEEMAANWNREETRDNMKVNIITCEGFIRAA